MLELAEDEQEYFIDKLKKKTLIGKKGSEHPVFTAIIGMPGTGKSTLAAKMQNTAVISGDNVMSEYCEMLGIDITEPFVDKEVGRFIDRVNREIIDEAVDRGINIAYDTQSVFRAEDMLEEMRQKGYQVRAKVMLADKYQAALNSVERKLDMDEKFIQYKMGERKRYPKGNTRLGSLEAASDNFERVVNYIKTANAKSYPVEVYEFGKDKPSFKSGEDVGSFFESLDLTPAVDQSKRAEKLSARAMVLGKEDEVIGLNYLRNRMNKEK